MKFSRLLRISWQFFRHRLFGNIIVIFELVIVCVLIVLISNFFSMNDKAIHIIENSPYRSLYYRPPVSEDVDFSSPDSIFSGDKIYDTSYLDKLDEYISEHDFVKGYQQHILSETALTPDFMTGARVQLLNRIGIEAFNFEISDGIWLSEADPDAEYIPVVIGGKLSEDYYVGQKLTTYYMVNETADASGLAQNEYGIPYKEYKLQVVGKLAYPELAPFSGIATDGGYPVRYCFADRTVNDLFMLIPYERYSDAVLSEFDEYFIFCDRNADSKQIAELQKVIGVGHSFIDEGMIAAQRKDTDETFDTSMPFIFLVGIIVLTGILSTSVLTTVSNMSKFRIYFLCGMSKKESISVILIFTILFTLISAAVFGLVMIIIGNIGLDSSVTVYFALRPQLIISIILSIIVISAGSFTIPAIIMNNTNVINLIRNYGKE